MDLGAPDPIAELMQNCLFKSLVSGVMGGALGSVFGLMFSGQGVETYPDGWTTRQKVVHTLRGMGKTMKSSGKQFASIGFCYSLFECLVEKQRGKTDIYNHIAAGALTGAWLGRTGGFSGVAFGAGGFAAFSIGMEYFITPKDPRTLYKPYSPTWPAVEEQLDDEGRASPALLVSVMEADNDDLYDD
mmetsp:Transcript_37186/g.93358  ORF Transcript_37186/g.93358 Transcript_37186/m.93358 type:complete len:187 (+) Transcript_37186:141-701(+)